nr:MAG TPA: hypothetical protein [Caudoviricetes sp.]
MKYRLKKYKIYTLHLRKLKTKNNRINIVGNQIWYICMTS